MLRILVTGSAGLIGRALVRRLLHERAERELEVRTFDLRPADTKGCVGLQGDVLDPAALAEATRGCDAVVHLAACLGVRRSEEERLRCLNVNITGTRNVLNACIGNRVRRMIYVSSSEVYGDNGAAPVSESSPLRPISVYAVSKLAGEEYVKAYAKDYGLEYTIVRPFNVYGPGQAEDFVIPRFVRAVLEGRPPLVYGDGRQVRAFCSVEDIVEGLTLALFSGAARGEVFNLGNDAGLISILDLGHKIAGLSERNGPAPRLVPFEHADRTRAREIFWRVPRIEKAGRLLGYAPRIPLDEGISSYFQGMKALVKERARGAGA